MQKRDGTKYKPIHLKNKNFQEMTLVKVKIVVAEILQNLIQEINFRKVKIMAASAEIASIVSGESDIYICLSLPGKNYQKIGILPPQSHSESSWWGNYKFR